MWPSFGILRSIYFDFGPVSSKFLALGVVVAAYLMPLSLAFYRWSHIPRRAWSSLAIVPLIIIGLGWVGVVSPLEPASLIVGLLLTLLYFLVFAAIFPLLARRPRQKSVF